MRSRVIIVLLAFGLLSAMAGCGGAEPKSPTLAPIPTKTPRPTFTHTPALPTATRLAPTATPQPTEAVALATPTPAATDTPAAAAKATLKASAVANVRSGPGTAYPKIGQLQEGQEFEVTGKNADGDWWQFDFNGKSGWVASSMVETNAAAADVEVAQAPAAPAPAPQPVQQAPAAPAPKPAQPAPTNPPPPPSRPYAAVGANPYPGNPAYVTVRCRLVADITKVVDRYTNRPGTLRVSGPSGSTSTKFGSYLTVANAAMAKTMQYMYQTNPDCKVELPYAAGNFTAVVLDDGGKEISDPIQFTASPGASEFLLIWNPR